MKKLFIIFGAALFFLISTSTASFAYRFDNEGFTGTYTYGNENQGEYLGTVSREKGNGGKVNDDLATLRDFLDYLSMDDINCSSLTLIGKSDEDGLSILSTQSNSEGKLISGTWATTAGSYVSLITVKAGNAFSVYWYASAASSGEWNVGYIPDAGNGTNNNSGPAAMSHVSGFLCDPATAPVPAPATFLLLGSGLVGFACFGRKKNKK